MALFREQVRQGRPEGVQAAGSGRLVLRGRVATMDSHSRVIADGLVSIENGLITSVSAAAEGVPEELRQCPVIETSGTIYPGLVELHNHPSYNAIPLWTVPERYPSRSAWRSAELYRRQVSYPATILTHHPEEIYPKSVARFVECRSLLGGVTTSQGLSIYSLGRSADDYEGLIRNVEFSYGPSWPVADDHIDDFTSYAEFKSSYGPVMNNPLRRMVLHLCEGTDQATREIFSNLIAPDGTTLIGGTLLAIHGTALGAPQFSQLRDAGGLIWSPTSNLLLYGATTDIPAALAAGLQIALGCDWAPSGTKNLVGELKIARLVSAHMGCLFSDERLVRMVTTIPAAMMGWDGFLGSVEAGKQADLLVLGGRDGDPYAGLIAATESDVAAVLVGGRLRAARTSLADPSTSGVELIRVADQSMVLDLVDDPSQPLANVTLEASIATLSDALEHLPELAASFSSGQKASGGSSGRLQIRLEMDEEMAQKTVAGAEAISPGDVDRLRLDPITAVDDHTFLPRLKANINLPRWLKDGL